MRKIRRRKELLICCRRTAGFVSRVEMLMTRTRI